MNTTKHPLPGGQKQTTFQANALGNTTRLLREHLNLTQNDLAILANVSPGEISKIENGSRKKLPLDTLIKLAPHLNVSLDYLLVSCIDSNRNDYERFYDYNGNEIDLFTIAKNLYSVDSGLLLLLSQNEFLTDPDSIKFVKSWLKLQTTLSKKTVANNLLTKIFEDFKKYCLDFMKHLCSVFEAETIK